MKSIKRFAACCLCAGGLAAAGVQAHHSIVAEFDTGAEVSFRGTVTDVEWFNPHIWVNMDVAAEDGSVQHWTCQMGAPNRLLRRGWRKEHLPPGTVVDVTGSPARDGSHTCTARRVSMEDGRLVFAGTYED